MHVTCAIGAQGWWGIQEFNTEIKVASIVTSDGATSTQCTQPVGASQLSCSGQLLKQISWQTRPSANARRVNCHTQMVTNLEFDECPHAISICLPTPRCSLVSTTSCHKPGKQDRAVHQLGRRTSVPPSRLHKAMPTCLPSCPTGLGAGVRA
jgi:hypothetical protein